MNFVNLPDNGFIFSFIVTAIVPTDLTLAPFTPLQNKTTFTPNDFHWKNSFCFNQKADDQRDLKKMDENLFQYST
jgi:hypothetical protein